MTAWDRELRNRLTAAGLGAHTDAVLALASPSIRLLTSARVGADGTLYRTPVEVPNLTSGVAAIAGSGYHNLALLANDSVMAWGPNDYGQLGDGTRQDQQSPVPVRGVEDAIAIAAGSSHSLAVRRNGSVVAWGDNMYGQLGDGTRDHRSTPVPVRDLDAGVRAVVAGGKNSLALRHDGSVVGWGLSVAGKLGIDHIPDRPVPIPGLDRGVVAIAAAGGHYHLALTQDGTVLAWGSSAEDLTPSPITELPRGVVAIATGGSHSLALVADGSLLAWGNNTTGQLGDRTTVKRDRPVRVAGLDAKVVAIAAGPSSSFAVNTEGCAFSWGKNYEGQLGDGSVADRNIPVPVTSLRSSVIATAPRVALRRGGSVVAWGGRLSADESAVDSAVPIGGTKLGGTPDLPAGSPWPWHEGRPMAFVGQVNLADVAPLVEPGLLPSAGVLSFFCASGDQSAGIRGHVSFTDTGTPLSRAQIPPELSPDDRYHALGLRPERELTYPSAEAAAPVLGLSMQERLAYQDAVGRDETPLHRMLGHPDVIQRDACDADPALCLLLQVDSDAGAELEWGDAGRLYFCIRRHHLEERRFDACHLDFQSY